MSEQKAASQPNTKKVTDVTNLAQTIANLAEAREQLKLWTAIKDEAVAAILNAITEGTGVVLGQPAVTVSEQIRRGLDTSRIKLEHPEIADAYATETSYKVVRVL